MLGGAGNDTYEVDDDNDVIVELAGEGTDQVNSTAAIFTLGAYIENLTLTGTADIEGTGNALGNKITGNTGANELVGHDGNDTLTGNDGNDILNGGFGADNMSGGKGNDTYDVDNIGDKITEIPWDPDRTPSSAPSPMSSATISKPGSPGTAPSMAPATA
jgi:Ca2+-binding RTX toxin-like protein